MYNLTHLQSFLQSLDSGTFSAAARALNVSQPAVSQHLQQLERATGQVLVNRSRKGLRPTQAGEVMQTYARRVLSDLAEMDEQLDALNGTVSGTLRFTTTAMFAQTIAVDFFAEMRKRAPDLKLDLIANDEVLDVEEHQIGMALRGGVTGNGGGVVRRVGQLEGVLVASPSYLDRVGRPQDASELAQLDYLQYRENQDQTQIPLLAPDGTEVIATVRPALSAHSPSLMLNAIESGLGFAQCPHFFLQEMLEAGHLEHVLPGYMCRPKPLFLVQPTDQINSLRNQLAREVLFEVMAQTLGLSLSQDIAREVRTAQEKPSRG